MPSRVATPGLEWERLWPTMADYQQLMSPYNEAAMPGTPRFVARPGTVEHVLDVIEQCRNEGLRLSVHATGHDFEARSLSGEVVIHLGSLSGVAYDHTTGVLTVGGGARVHDVNRVLSAYGRAISTGTNQDVGIAGLTLGGGAAYTSRCYGLTCDALLEVEICSFSGERFLVSDASHPELMALLRGGGGGHFGVITAFKFQTYPTTPVTTFSATWEGSFGARHLADLEECLVTAPRALSMRVGANVTGAQRHLTLTLSGQLQGGDESTVLRHFGALARHPSWTQATLPYYDAMSGALHQTSGGSFKIKSRFAHRAIGEPGLAALLAHLHTWSPTGNADGAGFGLFAWGGRIRDFPAVHSCMPGRSAEYLASFDTSWTSAETTAQVEAQLRWVHALDQLAAPYLSALSYINFPDSDDGAFAQRHLPPTLSAQIQALQARYDPLRIGHQESRCRQVMTSALQTQTARLA
jgi:hypothetical protein